MSARVEIVEANPPLVRLSNDGEVSGYCDYLTKDEAIRLAGALTDAADELEAAEAVSGE